MSLSAIERRIAALEQEMAAAAEGMDFERAARLRDEIDGLRGRAVRQPPPGQMGLGTNIPVAEPPKGWVRPRRPDPMTSNVRGRKR
jgi:septal ring factor EnvC (AmiA/AmiB activator)